MYSNRGSLTPERAYELIYALTKDEGKALNAQAEVLMYNMK